MNILKNNLILIFLFFTFSCKSQLLTTIEKNNYKKLSTNKEIFEFINKADSISTEINTEFFPLFENKYLPVVKISKKNEIDTTKLTFFIIAQQHGNEPSGKEASLLLIKEFANGKHRELLKKMNIIIIPQANPFGGDKNIRENSNNIDLNRDHLLLESQETQIIHLLFKKYMPGVFVDIHEYYPYSQSWIKFGYRRNFDIQFGGLTNVNIDAKIRNDLFEEAFHFVKKQVENDGYSFFEYTLGNFALSENLRHSTVDISDGRQSVGINNTLSFIIEGINGKDSIYQIERRVKSQLFTILALLQFAFEKSDSIKTQVSQSRQNMKNLLPGTNMSIRMDHFKTSEILKYPLYSIKNQKDSIFEVKNYFPEIKSTLSIEIPKGYLIPKRDSILCLFLKRSLFNYSEITNNTNLRIFEYQILNKNKVIIEEYENWLLEIDKKKVEVNFQDYYFVSTSQIDVYKIVTAFEPQSMYGLVNYGNFEYLINNEKFKILRVE